MIAVMIRHVVASSRLYSNQVHRMLGITYMGAALLFMI